MYVHMRVGGDVTCGSLKNIFLCFHVWMYMCSSVYLFVLVFANVYIGDVYSDMFIKMCFTCLHKN